MRGGVKDEVTGGLGGLGGVSLGCGLEHGVTHGRGLREDGFYGGVRAEDKGVEGEGVDDEELLDVFWVGLSKHEAEEAAEGVADDGGVKVIGGEVLVELVNDGEEERAGGVGAGGLSGEAVDLDAVETVSGGEEFGFGIENGAGAGEAWEEEDGLAGGGTFCDYGEAGGCWGGLGCLGDQRGGGEGREEDAGGEFEGLHFGVSDVFDLLRVWIGR